MSTQRNRLYPESPKETLPTMYDLPSEEIGGPGMPDEFHGVQASLLKETFRPPTINPDEVFSAIDINLYYDSRHTRWYKRPDWFGVVGVPRLYEGTEMRNSYVRWQEGRDPLIVVELLSPGTEQEDLGKTLRDVDDTPTKWEVYERILRVPYYVAFDGDTNDLHIFQLEGDHYQLINHEEKKLWIPSIELGLGLWHGKYEEVERLWLRWYDQERKWIPTSQELAEQEKQRAEQEKQRAEQEKQRAEQERLEKEVAVQRAEKLAAKLRELGIDPDQI